MPSAQYDDGHGTNMPSVDEVRALVDSTVYAAGKRSYENGDVKIVSMDSDSIDASVYDRKYDEDELIDVEFEDEYRLYTNCTCEESMMYSTMCKHAVAVLLYANDNLTTEDDDLYEDVNEETISHLLKTASPETMMSFLAKVMTSNTSVLHRFISENGLQSEYNISKYAADLTSLYKDAEKTDGKVSENLDFSEQFGDALRDRKDGNYEDAARRYKTLSESISERMDDVMDDSGYYADCFVEALEGMVECILRERLQHEKKRDYISYLFEKAAASKGGGFARYYRDALETTCGTNEDLEFWSDLLNISKKEDECADKGELAEMLRMQSHIWDTLGLHTEAASLLARHYSMSSDICIRYLQALLHLAKESEKNKTRWNYKDHSIMQATAAFPDDPKVLDAAYVVLSAGSGDTGSNRGTGALNKDRICILERLYAITGDFDHVIKMKHLLPDWNDARDKTIDRISDMSPKNAVGLCIKEDLHDKAMDMLESASDMELLLSCKSKMVRKRYQRYVTCYVGTLSKFAGSKSGKDHYKRVKTYLLALKDMPDCDKTYELLVSKIKKRYSARRVMLKELSDL